MPTKGCILLDERAKKIEANIVILFIFLEFDNTLVQKVTVTEQVK